MTNLSHTPNSRTDAQASIQGLSDAIVSALTCLKVHNAIEIGETCGEEIQALNSQHLRGGLIEAAIFCLKQADQDMECLRQSADEGTLGTIVAALSQLQED